MAAVSRKRTGSPPDGSLPAGEAVSELPAERVGLVLSGGGAKGAWEAGALKALAETGLEVSAVSGASVGALNGAVVSAARETGRAAGRLETAWNGIDFRKVLRPNPVSVASTLMRIAGAFLSPPPASGSKLQVVGDIVSDVSENGVFTTSGLREILDAFCPDAELERGLPLFVSLYRDAGAGAGTALERLLDAEFGHVDTKKPVFKLVQDLPPKERKEAILASATLPVVFGAGKVGEDSFRDGGIGGWKGREGNTPAAPLVNGLCRKVVILHLDPGSPWRLPAGARAAVLELSPARPLVPGGRMPATLDFSRDTIDRFLEQGYRDVKARASEVEDFLGTDAPRDRQAPGGPDAGGLLPAAAPPKRTPRRPAAPRSQTEQAAPKPPAGTGTAKPPSGTRSRTAKPPSGTVAPKPPAVTGTVKPPSGAGSKKAKPSDGTAKPPSGDGSKKAKSSDGTVAVKPPAATGVAEPPGGRRGGGPGRGS
ncbi:MAG: patatin-like phospholipase family protein [Deltaproteobacteria bacterium]|jgi:NTE family protein|nr:patatin-like phospholipase family protein [Deltaproteobacteria bacterium]